jgi:hypothetical protein
LGKGIAGTMLRDIAFHFEERFPISQVPQHVVGIQPFEKVLRKVIVANNIL